MRNKIIPISEVNKFRFKYDNIGVFATVYKYNSPAQNEALLLGDFYLDFDTNDGIEIVIEDALTSIRYMYRNYGINPELLSIYFSGAKGIHIIVDSRIIGVIPSKDLHRVFKMMAMDIKDNTRHKTIDTKIYDSKRLFRLPNSRHQKTKLYKIPITYQELQTLKADEIYQLAREPRAIKPITVKLIPMANLAYVNIIRRLNLKAKPTYNKPLKPLSYTPPCMNALLNQMVLKGQRNNSGAAIASFYRQQGLDKEECKHRMDEWNSKYCDPSMPELEVETILESVYKGEYKMGCGWLTTITECNKQECKLYKRRR